MVLSVSSRVSAQQSAPKREAGVGFGLDIVVWRCVVVSGEKGYFLKMTIPTTSDLLRPPFRRARDTVSPCARVYGTRGERNIKRCGLRSAPHRELLVLLAKSTGATAIVEQAVPASVSRDLVLLAKVLPRIKGSSSRHTLLTCNTRRTACSVLFLSLTMDPALPAAVAATGLIPPISVSPISNFVGSCPSGGAPLSTLRNVPLEDKTWPLWVPPPPSREVCSQRRRVMEAVF